MSRGDIMKKRIIAILMCFVMLSIFIVPASALSSEFTFEFPNEPVIGGMPSGLTAENVAEQIYENESLSELGYTSNNSYFFVNYNSYDTSYTVYVVYEDDIDYDVICKLYYSGQYRQLPMAVFTKGVTTVAYSLAGLNTSTYTNFTSVRTGNNTTYGICNPSSINPSYMQYRIMSFFYDSYYGFYSSSEFDYMRGYCFGTYIIPPYNPDYNSGLLVGFPVGLEFSVSDFMQWLVDNDKIDVSVDSGGASVGGKIPAYIGMGKLQSFLEFYKQFGGSNTSFVSRIWSWFSYMNIFNQTNDNVVILKNTIDSLYREYINSYKQEFYSNSANQAHHRRNVNTQTTDDDLTLVTDSSNDDIYTTLLREIIRGVVAVQSSTVSGCRAIIDTLNNLDFTVNLSNDGGTTATDLSALWRYDSNAFDDDINAFALGVEDVQNIPQGYIDTINQNALMPENMLVDKNSLTVNVPCITGFTIGGNGSTYSTQTGIYTLKSSDYPWLDPIVQKIKRFGSIILIIGYLVHLRFRIPELVRGE